MNKSQIVILVTVALLSILNVAVLGKDKSDKQNAIEFAASMGGAAAGNVLAPLAGLNPLFGAMAGMDVGRSLIYEPKSAAMSAVASAVIGFTVSKNVLGISAFSSSASPMRLLRDVYLPLFILAIVIGGVSMANTSFGP